MAFLDSLVDGLTLAGDMAWETWWALVLGFTLAGAVEAFVSEEWLTDVLGGDGWREAGLGTVFGAASSSCSFTAVATTKALFKKGASPVASLAAFQFASTNLVIELGLVLGALLGWQFVAADFLGGLVAIAVLAAAYKYVVPDGWFEAARDRLRSREDVRDPVCGMTVDPGSGGVLSLETDDGTEYFCSASCKRNYRSRGERDLGWRDRLASVDGWISASRNAVGEWNMLWEDIAIGFLVAGLIGTFVPRSWWTVLFGVGAEGTLTWILASSAIGVLVGAAAFVCSVGNVPFALVLWVNGVPFGSVVSFIFGDLLVPPIADSYRRYYGTRMATTLVVTMFLAAVLAGTVVHYVFAGLDLIPARARAGGTASEGYTLWLNVFFTAIFAVEVYVTFGPGRLKEAVRSLPRRSLDALGLLLAVPRGVQATAVETIQELRRASEAARAAFATMADAVRTFREALGLLGESARLLVRSLGPARESLRRARDGVGTLRDGIDQLGDAVRLFAGALALPLRRLRDAIGRLS